MCAGLRLDDLDLFELWAFVHHSPRDSAVYRATNPDWWVGPEVQMLREVHHGLAVLAWQRTEDATRRDPQNYPDRLPLTAEEVAAAKARQPDELDAVSVEEMNDWLGWAPRPSRN